MTDRPPAGEAPRTPQMFDPLATMVGEYARDFIHPKDRVEAIDRLYSMLDEARREAASAAPPECPHPLDRQSWTTGEDGPHCGRCGLRWFFPDAAPPEPPRPDCELCGQVVAKICADCYQRLARHVEVAAPEGLAFNPLDVATYRSAESSVRIGKGGIHKSGCILDPDHEGWCEVRGESGSPTPPCSHAWDCICVEPDHAQCCGVRRAEYLTPTPPGEER